MDKRTFFEEWFNSVWVEEDIGVISARMRPDVQVRGLTDEPQMSAEEFSGFAAAFHAQCNITSCTINHFCEQGEWAQMHVTFQATGRQSGKKATFTGQILARLNDDILVEGYNNIDFLSLFQQMDMLPADLMSRALRGDALI
ncbi:MAG: ester cyclase [Sulfitobacter sp.]